MLQGEWKILTCQFLLSLLYVAFGYLTSETVGLVKKKFDLFELQDILITLSAVILARFLVMTFYQYALHSKCHKLVNSIIFHFPKSLDTNEFSAVYHINTPVLKEPIDFLNLVNTIIYTLYSIYKHSLLTIILVSVLFAIPAVILYYQLQVLNRYSATLNHDRQQCTHYYTEYYTHFYTYKQFTSLKAKIRNLQVIQNKSQWKLTLAGAIGWSLFQFCSMSMLGAIYLLFDNFMDMMLFGMTLIQLHNVVGTYQRYYKKSLSWDKLNGIFDKDSNPADFRIINESQRAFNVKNLSCKIDDNVILKNLNFEVNSNTLILGHTNSGKSTLLRCLAKAIPFEGEVDLKSSMYMDQNMNFIESTVFDNIFMRGPYISHVDSLDKKTKLRYEELLKLFELDLNVLSSPNTLSMGQRQRICLMRYLIYYQNEWLLLDEPTSYLNQRLAKVVFHHLLNYKLIMVTHDAIFQEKFKIITLENGSLIENDKSQKIVKEAKIQNSSADILQYHQTEKQSANSILNTFLQLYRLIPISTLIYATMSFIMGGIIIPLQGHLVGGLFTNPNIKLLVLSAAVNAFSEINMQISSYFLNVLSIKLRDLVLNSEVYHPKLLFAYTEVVGNIQYYSCQSLLQSIRGLSAIAVAFYLIIRESSTLIFALQIIFIGCGVVVYISRMALNPHESKIIMLYEESQVFLSSLLPFGKLPFIDGLLKNRRKIHLNACMKYCKLKSIHLGILDTLPMICILFTTYTTGALILDHKITIFNASSILGILINTAVQLSSFFGELTNFKMVSDMYDLFQSIVSFHSMNNYTYKVIDKVSLENLSFSPILKEICVEFNEGITQIKGESGCGKSTLLRIIANLVPCKGTILTNFQNKILLVENDYLGGDILDNIYMGEIDNFDNLKQLFSDLHLDHLWGVCRSKVELSGGEKQRIQIIRGIIHPCKVLLMDEMTNALDHEMRKKVVNLLRKTGKIVVMVSHQDLEADTIYEIQNKNLIKL
eukprot:NODE_88_length_21789_cov_0.534440.p2 type:complete len:991 gc:universal NODE_88_length_21789_cov_0.534440:5002-2030(-)